MLTSMSQSGFGISFSCVRLWFYNDTAVSRNFCLAPDIVIVNLAFSFQFK